MRDRSAYPPKAAAQDLALFGGAPLFERPRSIGQLHAAAFEDFRPKLAQILRSRRLTNDGPFVQELERRLGEMHEVEHCIALANAGLGLMMLMQIFAGGRGGEVLMPAFSYRGLPHFAAWAGLQPRFCDVDPDTHVLDPADAARRITSETRMILAVATCQSCGPLEAYAALARQARAPVVFDSVYGLGMTRGGRPLGRYGAAEVFSLHATKLLNGFEGGYVTTQDDRLADQLRVMRNFLYGAPPPEDLQNLWGINAKLNEVHAAMALMSLDDMAGIIAANRRRYETYASLLAGTDGLRLVRYPEADGADYNYELAILEVAPGWPVGRDELVRLLRAEGAAVSAYYSPPLHATWPHPDGQRPSLPVAEDLAGRFLQLPVGDGVSLQDVEAVCSLIRTVADQAPEIAARLRARAPT